MGEIVKAIEKLAEKDILDYLLIIVPIFISFVAIIISITTARKQNKIALFERRFKCLSQMQMLFAFSRVINEYRNSTTILQLFDAYCGTDASLNKGIVRSMKAKRKLETIGDEIAQSKFLFKHKYTVEPIDLVRSFHKIIIESVANTVPDEMIDQFVDLCNRFLEIDYPELEKQTKIK